MQDHEDKYAAQQDFNFPGQKSVYHGKVRDVYHLENDKLLMIVSDRISAFDHILPKPIPYKGQVLNQLALYFLENTKDIVPNWVMASPDPKVTIGHLCEPIKIEMVIRGYLAGHAWRTYKSGKRVLCGVTLPEGLKQNDKLPFPIITPTTKASEGHDEDISEEKILKDNIINKDDWNTIKKYTHHLYERGQEMANNRGLILVDTKYEFGKIGDKIVLIDEIHTPDSSRYFYQDGYEVRQLNGEIQMQLSKEFVREWLMENGFQGLEGQKMPEMPSKFIDTVSERYIKLYEIITGLTFKKEDESSVNERIMQNVDLFFDKLKAK